MKRISTRGLNPLSIILSLFVVSLAPGYASPPNWSVATPGLPAPRQGPVFVTDEARQVAVLFGGSYLNDTWTFDGQTWTPQYPDQSPPVREYAGAAYDPDVGKIIVFGGAGATPGVATGVPILGDTWSWDGTSWIQISGGDPTGLAEPQAREAPMMAYDPNHHQVILFGGWNGNYAQYLNDTWAFDGQTWTQLHPTNSPPGRADGAIAYDPVLGQLILFGGIHVTAGNGVFGDMWTWTGTDWVQLNPAALPSARFDVSLAVDRSNNTVVLFGGTATGTNSLGDTWIWNGTTWSPQFPPRTPPARNLAGATYLPNLGKVVLFAGNVAAFEDLQDTWTWDGSQWNELISQPGGRYDPVMAYDPAAGGVVLFGGQSLISPTGPGFVNDTWIWNGSTWAQKNTVHSPLPRNSAAMIYDPAISKLVLFGGTFDFLLADTWVFDGTDWTLINTAHSPAPREDPSMVYDPALGKIVLFGGQGVYDATRGTGYYGDTWLFDGTDWIQVVPEDATGTSAPSRRSLAAAAYDPVNQVVVLQGGQSDTTQDLALDRGDTWKFDGTSWTRIGLDDPTGQSAPSPRQGARMEYDAALGGIILFGGRVNNEAQPTDVNDTWKWDGSSWSQLQPTNFPDGRVDYGYAYDPARQQILLFGGGSNTNSFNSDTWTFGVPAVQLTRVVSRISHGTSGIFDVDLTSGTGIECRTGSTPGAYMVAFTFATRLTSVAGATVASGIGSVDSSTIDPSDAHNYLVNLTGVGNAQRLTISLTSVSDSAGNFSGVVSAQMGLLSGDVNASGRVDAADVSSVRQQTLQAITSSNFRNDLNASGRIDAADVSIARQQTLTSLP